MSTHNMFSQRYKMYKKISILFLSEKSSKSGAMKEYSVYQEP